MTEEHLTTLFGDVTVVQVILWLIAAGLLIALIAKIWPSLTKLATSINLLLQLGAKLAGMDAKLERVRAQVENSHSTNLRDELDADRKRQQEQHSEVVSLVRGVQKDVGRLDQRDIDRGRQIEAIDTKLDGHIEWSRGQKDRIDDIEDTLNPKENPDE